MLYFYQPEFSDRIHFLTDEEYQHCVKVLRKKVGDDIGIFDGKGAKATVRISEITGKQCKFQVIEEKQLTNKPFKIHIAIAPTKNIDRIEWFVEKACELGVDEITFIQTENSERSKLRVDRLEKKAISALKQSKSGFLTIINPLIKLTDFFKINKDTECKYIAVVEDGLPYFSSVLHAERSAIILIGPEGDFSQKEVATAVQSGFQKISLGNSTLRTETAGLMASHFVNIINEY